MSEPLLDCLNLTPEDMATSVSSSSVQGEYVKTLEESEKLLLERTTSEQLARQLSRGLRIRRSADQRVIRSPSARKIGAIRRRSKDSPRIADSVIISILYSKFKPILSFFFFFLFFFFFYFFFLFFFLLFNFFFLFFFIF